MLGLRAVLFLIGEMLPRLRDVEQNLSLFLTVHSLGGLKALSREKIRSVTATAHEETRTRRLKGFADREACSMTAVLDARAKTIFSFTHARPKGTPCFAMAYTFLKGLWFPSHIAPFALAADTRPPMRHADAL
jgi:hypothetical protein